MKAKQIEKLLKGMYDNFVDSIDDENIKKIIIERTFITGGCIPSMMMDEFINDFDVYFENQEDANVVKDYYGSQKVDKTKKFHVKLITDNAINLSDKIQLIIRFTGIPEEVTKNFDWAHIKSYFKYPDKLIINIDTYRLIVEKELVYTGSQYPLSSLLRLKKYIKKGWNVSTKTMVHIVLDILKEFNKIKKENVKQKSFHEMVEEFQENEKEGKEDIEEELIIEIPLDEDLNEDGTLKEKNNFEVDIDTLIEQLNGVDPLTIQVELQKQCGKKLSIQEIIELL
jgi:hypothetical protein